MARVPIPRIDQAGWMREMRAAREPARLMAAMHRLPRRTENPRVVMTVPGLGAGDASMAPLRRYLRRVGHTVEGWGLGQNLGDVRSTARPFIRKVADLAERQGRSVDLVGWSLGGILSREAAREVPRLVRRVVTYGSPVAGNHLSKILDVDRETLEELQSRVAMRERRRIIVPVTAIYSRFDGVVPWEACIDQHGNDVEHIEVRSSHVGMGLDPDVWQVVAERLDRHVD